jgi:hypothetical protein
MRDPIAGDLLQGLFLDMARDFSLVLRFMARKTIIVRDEPPMGSLSAAKMRVLIDVSVSGALRPRDVAPQID